MGLVVWQAGFVLADLLLRRPPFGSWHGTQVLDLGCGTGKARCCSCAFRLSSCQALCRPALGCSTGRACLVGR